MGRDIKVAVVLPPGYADNSGKQYPILYALHGAGAPYDGYAAMPTLLAGLKDKPMIVACFDGDTGSWYLDTPLPQTWNRDKSDTSTVKALFTTFFFDEYLPALDKKYRINPKQRMLTGFSMGGYGAFHYMLLHPDMFCSVSGMSVAVNDFAMLDDQTLDAWNRFYGPVPPNRDKYVAIDPYEQIKADAAKGVKLPPICMRCGTEDNKHCLVDRAMDELLRSLHYSCDYKEAPGAHNWAYWKKTMPELLDFHWRTLSQNGRNAGI
jgi:S-formylglutathione hydrolase FrmB